MRLRFIKVLSVFFCLFCIFSLAAVKVFAIPTISGKVVLQGTGAGLPGIWVKWMEDYGTPYQSAYRFVKTDGSGAFNFVDLSTLTSGEIKKLQKSIDTNQDGADDDVGLFVDSKKPIPGYPGGANEFFHFNAANSPHAFTAVVPVGLSGTFNVVDNITINDVDSSMEIPDIEFTPSTVSTTPTPPPAYTISGRVFNDNNPENGIKDPPETGFPGAMIILSGDANATANSDSNGDYSFNNLSGGSYTVAIVVPVGKTVTTASSSNINLTKNQTGVDFGLAKAVIGAGCTASITGTVYNDLGGNGDGILNAGDVPISGWTIHLSAAGLPMPLTATTNGSGVYTFTGLCTGIFTVTQTVPPPWVTATGSILMSINDGENKTNINFFDAQKFTISGHVFDDPLSVGMYTGSGGRGGVDVFLFGTIITSVKTAADGSYTFTNLPVGSYKLIFGQVTGYRSTMANAVNIDPLINNQTRDYGLTPESIIKAGGACNNTSLDIVLVIDHSQSMSLNDVLTGKPKIDEAKEAASAFVDIMMQNLPTARIGIVQFSNSNDYNINNVGFGFSSSLLLPLTSDANQLKATISNISWFDDTCMQCGVQLANKALDDGTITGRTSQKMIIFLTDGQANLTADNPIAYPTYSYPENVAMEEVIDGVNKQNIVYYTIGLGAPGTGQIDEDFLKAVAKTNGGSYYNDPTDQDLKHIFTTIASEIIPTGAITGMVYEDKDPIGGVKGPEDTTPIANMSILLTGDNLVASKTTTSDGSGKYGFYGLCDSNGKNYTVTQSTMSPWLLTTPGSLSGISIFNGGTSSNNNFGNRYGYKISGSVFNDIDKDQIKDGGEINYPAVPSIAVNPAVGTVNAFVDGTYTITGLMPFINVFVSYLSMPSGYIPIYPGPPAIFNVRPGPGCNTNGYKGAACDIDGNITNLNFAISNSIPWMQTYGLDIRMDDGIDNPQPASTTVDVNCGGGSYAAGTMPQLDSGIIFSGDGSALFGQGLPSSTDRVVGGMSWREVFKPTPLKTSTSSLLAAADKAGITIEPLSGCSNNCNLPSQPGFYHISGDWVSDKNEVFSNGNHIFVSDGTIRFTGDKRIKVGTNATVIFSAKQDIKIDPSYGAAPTCNPLPEGQLQGIFSADHDITIEGNNGNCVPGPDKMLNIDGTLVVNAARGNGVFKKNRDLCGGNPKWPAITIKARPDFLLHIPGFLTEQNSISHEETP